MIIGENVHHQDITADIGDYELTRIKDFIKGAVYSWCKNNGDPRGEGSWFTADDLFGGLNSCWDETPLQLLTDTHKIAGTRQPAAGAWKDLSCIIMKVLAEDRRRSFLTGRTEKGKRTYQWTGIDSYKP